MDLTMPIIEEVEDVGSQLVPYQRQGELNVVIPPGQAVIPQFYFPLPRQSFHEEQLARLERRKLQHELELRRKATQRVEAWQDRGQRAGDLQLYRRQQGQLAEVERKGSFLANQNLVSAGGWPTLRGLRKSAKDLISSVIRRRVGSDVSAVRQDLINPPKNIVIPQPPKAIAGGGVRIPVMAKRPPAPPMLGRIDEDEKPIIQSSSHDLTASDYRMPYGMRRYGGYRRRYPYGALRRAYKTGIRRGRWPPSKYASIKVERGGPYAKALGMSAGAKYSEVGAEEQALRKALHWRGKGMYSGSGGYLGQLIGGGLGAVAAHVVQAKYPALSAIPNLQGYATAGGAFVGDAAEEAARGAL